VARLTRRIDRLERESRRWRGATGVILAGVAALAIGGGHRPATIRAQPLDTNDRSRPCSAAKVELALRALRSINRRINTGAGVMNRDELIILWSRRLLVARLEAGDGSGSRLAPLEAHLTRMKELEAGAIHQYRERRISDLERMEMEFHRLEAESWSARAKAGGPPWAGWVWN
jgi:hypothetical protein